MTSWRTTVQVPKEMSLDVVAELRGVGGVETDGKKVVPDEIVVTISDDFMDGTGPGGDFDLYDLAFAAQQIEDEFSTRGYQVSVPRPVEVEA